MDSLLNFSLFTFGALAAILNPVGILPQYIMFTSELSLEEKRLTIKRASLIAGTLLLSTSLLGSIIFKVFGITAPAFKIAGGIILFVIALDMLHVKAPRSRISPEEHTEGVEKEDISAFPLAIPLIASPGSMTTVIMLGERANTLYEHLVVSIALIICLFILYLVLNQAVKVSDHLGRIGMNVLTRLMGLILAAIAVQFIIDGITTFQNAVA